MNIIELEIKTSNKWKYWTSLHKLIKHCRKTIFDGICFIYSPHTTCGLMINEHADPTVALAT